MPKKQLETLELDIQKTEQLLARVHRTMNQDDADLIRRVFESYSYVSDLVEDKETTIARLRQLFFGSKSEKKKDVLGDSDAKDASETEPSVQDSDNDSQSNNDEVSSVDQDENGPTETQSSGSRRRGHGRNSADEFRGGDQVTVLHESLEEGDTCPDCLKGTLNESPPGVFVRIVGRAPLHSTVYRTEKLRCNLCGNIFTAPLPEEAGSQRYDETAASMIALLKYGSGLPFNRLERLQRMCEIPLPASTQWDVLSAVVPSFEPVHAELIRQAAQGDVVYNDDTTVKILEHMGVRAQQAEPEEEQDDDKPARTGLYTSGVVSTCFHGDRMRIALFFSGLQHAGENLEDVLQHRSKALSAPIQMCDGLSRNLPKELETIVANCLAHARRKFVEVHDRFEDECTYVIEALSVIYANDKHTNDECMSPQERLEYHQAHSRATMEALHAWLEQQFSEKHVEPNSQLGEAITYLLKRWDKLTLFLRKAGAPLDNNLCERALKKSILHRKNSLFYRSQNGAEVGDMFMSLIYTCELNGINPFEYLNTIQQNAAHAQAHPENWLPWNHQDAATQVA